MINHSIFFAINNGLHSSIADAVIGNATYIGNGFIAFPIALIVMFFIDRAHLKRNFLFLLSAVVIEAIILQTLKSLINAPRPLSVFEDQIKQGQVIVYVMFDKLYGRGFPSGHTQTIWCCAAALIWMSSHSMLERPTRRLIAVISVVVAVLVSISRIYVGAHFPSDVLGGFVIGVVPVWLIGKYLDRKESRQLALPTSHTS